MALTLRNTKGTPLTYTEMDNNLTYLEGLGTSGLTIPTLSEVLISGNTTSGNDIVITLGDKIKSSAAGPEIEFFGGPAPTMLYTTDNGLENETTITARGGVAQYIGLITSGYDQAFELYGNGNGATLYDLGAGPIRLNSAGAGGKLELWAQGTGGEIEIDAPLVDVKGDISIANTKVINAASGGGQLNLRTFGDGQVSLTNDSGVEGSEGLVFRGGPFNYLGLFTDGYDAAIEMYGSGNGATIYDLGAGPIRLNSAGAGGKLELWAQGTGGEIEIDAPIVDIKSVTALLPNIPTYANNADAVAGGLALHTIYKTVTGELRIVI